MKLLNILILLLISSSIISRKSKKVLKKIKTKTDNYFIIILENSGQTSSVNAENIIDSHTPDTLLGSNPLGWEFKLTGQIQGDLAKFLLKNNDKYYIPYRIMNLPISYDFVGNREYKYIRLKVYDEQNKLSSNLSVRLPYSTWGYYVTKEVGEQTASKLKSIVENIANTIKTIKTTSYNYADKYLTSAETVKSFNDKTARINSLNSQNVAKDGEKNKLAQDGNAIKTNISNLENQLNAEKIKLDDITNKIGQIEIAIQTNLGEIKKLEDTKTDINSVNNEMNENKRLFLEKIDLLKSYTDQNRIERSKNIITNPQPNVNKVQMLQNLNTEMDSIYFAPK